MIMNNLELYIKNDTTKIVTNDDTLTYLCAEHQECNNQYNDFLGFLDFDVFESVSYKVRKSQNGEGRGR